MNRRDFIKKVSFLTAIIIFIVLIGIYLPGKKDSIAPMVENKSQLAPETREDPLSLSNEKGWYIIRLNNYHQLKVPQNFDLTSFAGNNGSFPFQGNTYNQLLKIGLYDYRILQIELRKKSEKQTRYEYLKDELGISNINGRGVAYFDYGGKPGLRYINIDSNPYYLIEVSPEEMIVITCSPNCIDQETLSDYLDKIPKTYKNVYVKPANPSNITYVDPLNRFTIEIPKDWDIQPLSQETNESGDAWIYKNGDFRIEISAGKSNKQLGSTPKESFLSDEYHPVIQQELKNVPSEFRAIVQGPLIDAREGENIILSLIKGPLGYLSVRLYPNKAGQAASYVNIFDQVLSTLKFN